MIAPKTVVCQGIPWRVRFLSRKEMFAEHEEDLLGNSSYTEAICDILDSLSPEMQAHIALHEILHGILHGIGMDVEEKDVRNLGTALFTLIRSNPDFIAYVQNPEKEEKVTKNG